jgi:ABC-2 type transport system ATP-binding protein
LDNVLQIKNLNKTYEQFSLKDINITLPRGYIMGFIGPNGAGKSTTIKLIMNLVSKDSGIIEIFGRDNIKHNREVKSKIGFVYDDCYFYEELTVSENKNIIAPFYREWDDSLFNRYIKEFKIPKDRKIKKLSKGMKMKFSLAIALSHNAELIIMDEPTSGLDPVFRSELLDILLSIIQDENVSILFSTHLTTDLEKVADYITFINNGKIVFSEPKDNIFEEYAVVKGSRELIDNDTRREFIGVRENSFGFEALTNNISKIKKVFGNDVIIERPSLEDIMVYTVRGDI